MPVRVINADANDIKLTGNDMELGIETKVEGSILERGKIALEAKLFYENHQNIALTITNQRLSISGVDEDEEALDLVKFQNAYNLASKMISVMAEMYDQLILNTAV